MSLKFETTSSVITSNSGLSYIASFLNSLEVRNTINRYAKFKLSSQGFSDYDVIKCMIALISLSKPSFDAIDNFRKDAFFKDVFNLKSVPSGSRLRQRVETFPKHFQHLFEETNMHILKRNELKPLRINGNEFMLVRSDVTSFDNTGTKKEGVSRTYKGCDGYSPMISYIGEQGFMLNHELREGSANSNCEGTLHYFDRTLKMAKELTGKALLLIMDSAHDDIKLISNLQQSDNVNYIIKRNPRKKKAEEFLQEAKALCKTPSTPRVGLEVYSYEQIITREFNGETQEFKAVTVVKSEEIDRNLQKHLFPIIKVESYWVKLDAKIEDIVKLYHDQGRMEQYHSEFKTDLRIERLPSQKFKCNETILRLSQIVYNLLRGLGDKMLSDGYVPNKKKRGKRIKLNTIIQNIMYMAGYFIKRKAESVLKFYKENRWQTSFISVLTS